MQVILRNDLEGLGKRGDIVEAIEEQTGIKLDRKSVHLDEHIKTLGEHTATASLHHAVSFPIRVEVVAKV